MLVIGSDHAGYELKLALKKYLDESNIEYIDMGCNGEPVDYPDIAAAVCGKITDGTAEKGVLVCGTGIGISMAANKVKGIRAALCENYFSAKFTRLHNDANVICFGGRTTGAGLATELLDVFLNTEFEGGRHARRVEKIMELEK